MFIVVAIVVVVVFVDIVVGIVGVDVVGNFLCYFFCFVIILRCDVVNYNVHKLDLTLGVNLVLSSRWCQRIL